MEPSGGTCPVDIEEVAEAYVLGQLSSEESLAFELHVLTCLSCAQTLEDTRAYIRAMTNAARDLRERGPVS